MEDITPTEAMAYEYEILSTIAKENWHFEDDRGLAEYLDEDILKEKVLIYGDLRRRAVERHDRRVDRSSFWRGNSRAFGFCGFAKADGYGEGLEQRTSKIQSRGTASTKVGGLMAMHIVRYYGLGIEKLWSGPSVLTLRKLQEYWPSKTVQSVSI